jgi:hypothetical protein
VLWTRDRVRLALRMAGSTIEEFKKWYLENHKTISRKEFGRNVNALLKSRRHQREGGYLDSIAKFVKLQNPNISATAIKILTGEVSLINLDRQTSLPFKELLEIPNLTPELREVVKAVARRSVNRDKLEPILAKNLSFVKDCVCGQYDFYRLHSTIPGLIIDRILFELSENDEIICRGRFCNLQRKYDEYEGRAIFDGEKVFAILTKTEVSDRYIDSVTISILFHRTYIRFAGILSGSVDNDKDDLCAARVALVRTRVKDAVPRVVSKNALNPEQAQLFEKLNNFSPLFSGGDRVMRFNNAFLNTDQDGRPRRRARS